MRKTVALAMILTCGALLGAALTTRAEDKKKEEAPDEKAAIEAMMKAAAPGEQHKRLERFVGTWDVTVKMWLDPSKEPGESKGTAESKMIMGGRYLEEKVTGEFGGDKFHGHAITGYDNLRKQYTSTWIDNMGTGIMIQKGSYDADKKAYTYLGEEIDPLSGKPFKTRSVIHPIDKDNYEVDMYKEVGGKEVRMMHLDYKRKAEK